MSAVPSPTSGGRVVLGTPKSHQSRTVPLPRFLAAELVASVTGKRADQLVFTMPGGGVMRLPNWDAPCSSPPTGARVSVTASGFTT